MSEENPEVGSNNLFSVREDVLDNSSSKRFVQIKISAPGTDDKLTLKLKPGVYFIGRAHMGLDVKVLDENGNLITNLWDFESLLMSRNHLRLTVRGDGRVFIRDYGKDGRGSTNGTKVIDELLGEERTIKPMEEVELTPGKIVALADVRFRVEQVGDKTVEALDKAEKSIKTEVLKTFLISKSVEEPLIMKYIKANERIAGEVIDEAKSKGLVKQVKETGSPISIVTPSAFTTLFLFVLENGSKLVGSLHDIRNNILSSDRVLKSFYNTVKDMVTSVETYTGDMWIKKDDISDIHVWSIVGGLLKSNIFLFKLKQLAEKVRSIDRSNPNQSEVMQAYSEAVKVTGMISPALILSSQHEIWGALRYMQRMDKVLTGQDAPLTKFEEETLNQYRLSQSELAMFNLEIEKVKQEKGEVSVLS